MVKYRNYFEVLSIAFLAIISYYHILDYYFPAIDTFALIESSVIHSWSDVGDILLSPLMHRSEFPEVASKYYRPTTVLIFGIEYAIWGLNPFGYQLSNLFIHVFVSIGVYWTVRRFFRCTNLIAVLTSVLFTLHPLVLEVIPAVARRQDALATLFVLIAMITVGGRSFDKLKRSQKILTGILFLLAVGAKEIAIIFPAIIWIREWYIIKKSRDYALSQNSFIDAVWRCKLLLLLTVIYLIGRYIILGDMGGVKIDQTPFEKILMTSEILRITPYRLFQPLFLFTQNYLSVIIFLFMTLAFGAYRYQIIRRLKHVAYWASHRIYMAIGAGVIILGLILFNSSIHNKLLLVTEFLYRNKGFLFSHVFSFGEQSLPIYIGNMFFIYSTFKYLLITLLGIFMIWTVTGKHLWKVCRQYVSERIIVNIFWLLSITFLMAISGHFASRTLYMALVPFCLLISIAVNNTTKILIREFILPDELRLFTRKKLFYGGIWLLLMLFIFNTIRLSSLVQKYDDWRGVSNLKKMLLVDLQETVRTIPSCSTLKMVNVPKLSDKRTSGENIIVSETTIRELSIKSWLDLKFTNRKYKIAQANYIVHNDIPEVFSLETTLLKKGIYQIKVLYK